MAFMKENSWVHRYPFWAELLLWLAAIPACEKKAGVVADLGVTFEWRIRPWASYFGY
jgi:hypothetical protein